MATTQRMSGARKAAVLTLILGEEASSGVFKYLQEDEIERIAREVAAVGSVNTDIGEQVLEEFHQMSLAASYVARGGVDYAQKLLLKTLGADTARRILDRVVKSFQSTAGFT